MAEYRVNGIVEVEKRPNQWMRARVQQLGAGGQSMVVTFPPADKNSQGVPIMDMQKVRPHNMSAALLSSRSNSNAVGGGFQSMGAPWERREQPEESFQQEQLGQYPSQRSGTFQSQTGSTAPANAMGGLPAGVAGASAGEVKAIAEQLAALQQIVQEQNQSIETLANQVATLEGEKVAREQGTDHNIAEIMRKLRENDATLDEAAAMIHDQQSASQAQGEAITKLQADSQDMEAVCTELDGLVAKLQAQSEDTVQRAVPTIEEKLSELGDACNQLMDVLDTAPTTDDLEALQHELTASVEGKLQAASAAASEETAAAHERLESTAEAIMKQVEDVGQDAEREEQRIQAEVDQVKIALEGLALFEREMRDEVADLGTSTTASVAAVGGRLEQVAKELQSSFHSEIEGQFVSRDASIHSLGEDIKSASNRADSKHAHTVQILDTRLHDMQASLDEKIKVVHESLTDKISLNLAGTEKKFEQAIAQSAEISSSLNERVEHDYGELRQHMGEQNQGQNEYLKKNLTEYWEKARGAVLKIEGKYDAMEAALKQSVDTTDLRSQKLADDVERVMGGLGEAVDRKVVELERSLADTQSEFGTFVLRVSADQTALEVICARVDEKMGAMAAQTDKEVKENKKRFVMALDGLGRHVKEELDRTNERAAKLQTQLTTTTESLEKKHELHVTSTEEAVERLDGGLRATMQQADNTHAALTERADAINASQDKAIASLNEHLNTGLTELQRTVLSNKSAIEQRVESERRYVSEQLGKYSALSVHIDCCVARLVSYEHSGGMIGSRCNREQDQ